MFGLFRKPKMYAKMIYGMKKSVRLPAHIKPSHYQIQMKPDLDDFTFTGKETISLQISKPTKQVTLHAVDLKIHYAAWQEGKKIIEAKEIKLQEKDETASFIFPKNLSGKGKLIIEFEGELTEALRGFYRSSYQHKDERRHLAVTQFESTDARRAFPSFDEPAHKAIFKVSLIVPESLTAISNTLEEKIEPHDPGYKVVHFTDSPKMSTYLLAFVVGDFEFIETKSKDGVKIRVFTTPGKIKQAKFALDVAKRSLEFMNNYFAIKYPLPVLDLIAIPDFAAGAMENWGAVTFSEVALLIDEKHSPFILKQRVAEVIAHELVHQWFGNLVTMEWWTHLWLNESFATYMAHVTLDHIFPEWKIWTKFVLQEQSYALSRDVLQTSQPVEVEVNSPAEISQSFDPAIVYAKGASVLRMLENYIGATKFRDGLRYYLKKHSYKNTASVHLWEAFEKVSNKPVRKLMHGWTTQSGYPLISIAEQSNRISLAQQRFQTLGSKKQTHWMVPVQIQTEKNKTSPVYLLSKNTESYKVGGSASFLKLNAGEHGFYRAHYDPGLLAQLLVAASGNKLDLVDRLGLMRDLFALAKAGYNSSDVFLEALTHQGNETSYIVWQQISEDLAELYYLFSGTSTAKQIEQLALPLLRKLMKRLGWQPRRKEQTSESLLRAVVISNLGLYGDKATIAKARQLFAGHLRGKLIPADLRGAVYRTVAQHGSKKDWQNFQKLYDQATMQEEMNRLAMALILFSDRLLVKKTLQFLFSDKVRMHVLPFFLAAGLQNPATQEAYWSEIKNRWAFIKKKYLKGSLLSRIIIGCRGFKTERQLKDTQRFFKMNRPEGAELKLKQTLELIKINIKWLKRDTVAVKKFLNRSIK